ncbi:hypothetical protein LIER_33551 [Lithospermum erythrorhizon]|uniref:GDSL esterase/lipase At5g03610-like n=1 Tax=Lithospermum erythrorhizon TaxID=34254 RepID=A0AAV3RYS5_LITER
MQFTNLFLTFFHFSILLLGGNLIGGVHGSTGHRHQKEKLYSKLFVFGDSYADTGNSRKTVAGSWKEPYGVTFPGKPSGRYSNGRVLTDYIAKHLGVKSPVAYRWMKYAGKSIRHGINFAYGGTGVFDTLITDPNMSTQIDFFNKLIDGSTFTKHDLQSSLVFVTLSGNDYGAYLAKGGTNQGLPSFIATVVEQLAKDLGRLHSLGAKKVAVTALAPLGCLPRSTSLNSFQQCNADENTAVNLHNLLVQQAVAKLNNETKDSTFVILDLYNSFTIVLDNKTNYPGSLKFESPLKPCCMGTSHPFSCGDVNEKGEKMYTVCADPKLTFFWDNVHPTQAGWNAVYNTLQATLFQQQVY